MGIEELKQRHFFAKTFDHCIQTRSYSYIFIFLQQQVQDAHKCKYEQRVGEACSLLFMSTVAGMTRNAPTLTSRCL